MVQVECKNYKPCLWYQMWLYNQPPGTDDSPREGIYIGESSRSLHERALEHVRDAQAFSAKSQITKHWMNSHPSLPSPPEMEFSITSRFRDCLSRQIGEALRISYSKDTLLNSKAEYMANSLSRLTMKEDPWELRERTRKEEEMEELNKKQVEEFKRMKSAQPCSTVHETVPVQETEPCEKVENTTKRDVLEIRASQNDQLTTASNRPAREPLVNLGQSNRSPCSSLVYTKGRDGGQDEHPWMKGVPERVDESGVKLVNGGPCHLYGGGAPQQKINTRASGLFSQTISPSQSSQSSQSTSQETRSQSSQEQVPSFCDTVGCGGGVNTPTGTECNTVSKKDDGTPTEHYETDEEEFSRPGSAEHINNQQVSVQAQLPATGAPKFRNTAKQKVKVKTRTCQGYNLGYLSMWWKRMDREGKKEEEERKRKEEEAKRRAHVKRWLSTKKEKLKQKKSTKQRLGSMGPGEGGDIPQNILKLDQHPETSILLGGGATDTGEQSPGFVEGVGEVTNTDNTICERSQPSNYQHVIFEHHQEIGTDKTAAVNEVSLGASESESILQSISQ